MLHIEDNIVCAGAFRRENLLERPAGDEIDNLGCGDFGGTAAGDHFTVAHDRNPVGELVNFMQPVGDINNGDALLAQAPDEGKQLLDIVVLKRFCRLIQNQYGGIGRQGAGDFDDMTLGQRQFLHALMNIHAQLVSGNAGNQSRCGGFSNGRSRKLQVLVNREITRKLWMLIGNRDALLTPRAWAPRRRLALHQDRSSVSAQNAGGHANHRRLARTVFAHDGMDLAGIGRKIHTFESMDSAIGFMNSHKLEDWR